MAGEPIDVSEEAPHGAPGHFAPTRWSVVLTAGKDDSQGSKALEELCRIYWLPIYGYIRRQGYAPHDAEDVTQGFFYRLLRLKAFAGVDPEKGKFRTFLLASLNHFLSDERDRARAAKRGGGQTIISLDEANAEQRYLQIPNTDLAPEKAFDRRWALTVLEEALQRLREEFHTSGKQVLFDGLNKFLSTEATAGAYEAVATELGMSPGSVPVAVHRLRQRYRECIRLELAQTVSDSADLEDEMNYLFAAIGG